MPDAERELSNESPRVTENGGRRFSSRTRLLVGVVSVVVLLALLGVWSYFSVRESTDDAQIEGHVNPVAARVGGTVAEVLIEENQRVEKGAPLVRIDPKDYDVAVAKAEADLAADEADARAAGTAVPVTTTATTSDESGASSELEGADAHLGSARARLREAEAKATQASQDLARINPLVAKDEVSRQEHDDAATAADAANAMRDAAEAEVRQAQQAVETARARLARTRSGPAQIAIQQARAAAAKAKADQAKAVLAQAKLNRGYTDIIAPVAGIVSRRSVEVGQVVQPGQPLLAIVPLDDVWVVANFKENQLKGIRPGQKAEVSVDAYGGRTYKGHVESVSPATGARFSLLPPENATGNFVKVVQRVPVKILFDGPQDQEHPLRPGMSVVPTVYTR